VLTYHAIDYDTLGTSDSHSDIMAPSKQIHFVLYCISKNVIREAYSSRRVWCSLHCTRQRKARDGSVFACPSRFLTTINFGDNGVAVKPKRFWCRWMEDGL